MVVRTDVPTNTMLAGTIWLLVLDLVENPQDLSISMKDNCLVCKGYGVVEGVKEVDVTIPAGNFHL